MMSKQGIPCDLSKADVVAYCPMSQPVTDVPSVLAMYGTTNTTYLVFGSRTTCRTEKKKNILTMNE